MGKRGRKKEKSLLEKWVLGVTLAVGVLGVIGWFLDLPEKLGWRTINEPASLEQPSSDQLVAQVLSGSIQDHDGEPLPGVTVSLPDFQGAATVTNELGRFELQVTAHQEQEVTLIAQKMGYRTEKRYPTLGNTGLNFIMRRKS